MSILKTSRLAIASLAVIGGCAGGGSQLTSGTQPVVVSSIDAHGGRHYTFVSDYLTGAVDVFSGTRQIGQITGFNEPEGLTTDSSGNLYVANTDGHDVKVCAALHRRSHRDDSRSRRPAHRRCGDARRCSGGC